MVLDHLLPSIQPESFLEWTRTSFVQSLADIYTPILQEHLHVAFRDVGGGNLFLSLVSKIDQSGSVMFKSSDYAGQGRCRHSSSCSSNHD
jgi:hypothetical protein